MPPQYEPDTSFHQELYDVADHIEKKTNPQDDEKQGKDPSGLADGIDFTVTDRGQGNHRHVKRIQNRPILYQHIPAGPKGNQEYGKQNDYKKVGCTIQNTVRNCSRSCISLAIIRYLQKIQCKIILLSKGPVDIFYLFQQPGTYPFIGFLHNRLNRSQHILIAGPQFFDDRFAGLVRLIDVEIEHITG